MSVYYFKFIKVKFKYYDTEKFDLPQFALLWLMFLFLKLHARVNRNDQDQYNVCFTWSRWDAHLRVSFIFLIQNGI